VLEPGREFLVGGKFTVVDICIAYAREILGSGREKGVGLNLFIFFIITYRYYNKMPTHKSSDYIFY
jgi:hypothetical protein